MRDSLMTLNIPTDRFTTKLKLNPVNGCIEWTGALGKGGYGYFSLKGRMTSAPRVAWLLFCGSIPEGNHVLHKCDNRKCVNIHHLFLGTNKDNMRDKVRKGRQTTGERFGSRVKLTEKKILEIRKIFQSEGVSHKTLAKRFNVSPMLIGRVLAKKLWKHI